MTIEEATRESYARAGTPKEAIEVFMKILIQNCNGIHTRQLIPGTEEEFIVAMMNGESVTLDYRKFVLGEKGFAA